MASPNRGKSEGGRIVEKRGLCDGGLSAAAEKVGMGREGCAQQVFRRGGEI